MAKIISDLSKVFISDNVKGLKFDGVNDYISVAHDATLNFDIANPFSISLWVKPVSRSTTFNQFYFLQKRDPNDNYKGYDLYTSSDTSNNITAIYFRLITNVGNGQVATFSVSGLSLPPNIKYHIVVCHDGAFGATIYIDGVSQSVSTAIPFTPTDLTHTEPLYIGNLYYSGTDYVSQQTIYDLKIFNVQLSSTEVGAIYSSKGANLYGTLASNIMANWVFTDRENFTLKDYSGNANDGTLINYTNGDVGLAAGTNKWLNYDFFPQKVLKKN